MMFVSMAMKKIFALNENCLPDVPFPSGVIVSFFFLFLFLFFEVPFFLLFSSFSFFLSLFFFLSITLVAHDDHLADKADVGQRVAGQYGAQGAVVGDDGVGARAN